ncbi:helix-turn-helix transcriptional regulator [Taibaiella koreensis]|uniref:helix-turn-helix transcriptional regulator n=1 Tax=Taibaiella koreensis TaxID=1268548 RepID=UPI000E59BFAC|nr:AraC family transcriptional regulator [Taibaiella koreensis]
MVTEMATLSVPYADAGNRTMSAEGGRLLDFKTPATSGIIGIAGPGQDAWKQVAADTGGNRCFTVFFMQGDNPLFMPPLGMPGGYNGHIFIDKPRYKILPGTVQTQPLVYACFDQPDAIFRMLKEQYGVTPQVQHYGNSYVSLQIAGTPELEYIYYYLGKLQALQAKEEHIALLVKDLVSTLLDTLMGQVHTRLLDRRMIRNHAGTIERAKSYIFEHFMEEITLAGLARHCYASPFHFSRIFKQFSAYAPHQYIQALRLKHAELLLRTTDLPIAEISTLSGFRRTDYFSAAFKKRYKMAPSGFKRLSAA